MPTDLEQLKTAHSQVLARIVEITAAPKPTYMIDGEMWKWGEYFESLLKARDELAKQLAAAEPFTHVSVADSI